MSNRFYCFNILAISLCLYSCDKNITKTENTHIKEKTEVEQTIALDIAQFIEVVEHTYQPGDVIDAHEVKQPYVKNLTRPEIAALFFGGYNSRMSLQENHFKKKVEDMYKCLGIMKTSPKTISLLTSVQYRPNEVQIHIRTYNREGEILENSQIVHSDNDMTSRLEWINDSLMNYHVRFDGNDILSNGEHLTQEKKEVTDSSMISMRIKDNHFNLDTIIYKTTKPNMPRLMHPEISDIIVPF